MQIYQIQSIIIKNELVSKKIHCMIYSLLFHNSQNRIHVQFAIYNTPAYNIHRFG